MDIITLLFIAAGLAMDAFAVSVSNGMIIKKARIREAMIFGLFFGVFQFLMPIIGWRFGKAFAGYMAAYDHWIAFLLLAITGGNMIRETFEDYEVQLIETNRKNLTVINMLSLAVATSIDALAVGVSFAFINMDILISAAMIGIVTFTLSFSGVFLGRRIGDLFKTRAERLGGLILILIGVRIVAEHLMAEL